MPNGPINFDLDRLSTLHFNPLLSGCGQRLELSTEIDPDSNFYFGQLNCRYFTESKFNCDIKGYNFVHNYRKDKTGGGVGLYLDSTLEFKTRYDLAFNDSRIESLFVEICRPRTKNISYCRYCLQTSGSTR